MIDNCIVAFAWFFLQNITANMVDDSAFLEGDVIIINELLKRLGVVAILLMLVLCSIPISGCLCQSLFSLIEPLVNAE